MTRDFVQIHGTSTPIWPSWSYELTPAPVAIVVPVRYSGHTTVFWAYLAGLGLSHLSHSSGPMSQSGATSTIWLYVPALG